MSNVAPGVKTTLTEWLMTGAIGSLAPGVEAICLEQQCGLTNTVGPKGRRPTPGHWLWSG